MTEERNRDCRQCGAAPGERHRPIELGDGSHAYCDLARCRQTGTQLIQCEGELHEFKGRWYGEHEGDCGPDVWDGEYPGVKQARELGLFTDHLGMGLTEDLNELVGNSDWDAEKERYVYRGDKGRKP